MFNIQNNYYTLSIKNIDKNKKEINKQNMELNEKYRELLLSTGYYEEKKSKFYSYIFSVSSQDLAIDILNEIKRLYYDARHEVYLYSLIEDDIKKIKFSDDGEPQGTGTKAIYEMLEKENLTNILVIIVRYFGGTLLRSWTSV